MAKIDILENKTTNGDSTPILITSEMRSTYNEVILGIFGTFDGATVEAKVSRDAGGTDIMQLGTEAVVTSPRGIALNVPSKDDLYLFLTITSAGGSTDVSAEVYA